MNLLCGAQVVPVTRAGNSPAANDAKPRQRTVWLCGPQEGFEFPSYASIPWAFPATSGCLRSLGGGRHGLVFEACQKEKGRDTESPPRKKASTTRP
jgi:hypothetical protein